MTLLYKFSVILFLSLDHLITTNYAYDIAVSLLFTCTLFSAVLWLAVRNKFSKLMKTSSSCLARNNLHYPYVHIFIF